MAHSAAGSSPKVRHFFTKVVGVTHKNPDGSNRQRYIESCSLREELRLAPEPDNRYDSDAVKVCRATGQQLGYLDSVLASEVAAALKHGVRFRAYISDLRGGTPDKPTRGVNLLIVRIEGQHSESEVEAHAARALDAECDSSTDIATATRRMGGATAKALAVLVILAFLVILGSVVGWSVLAGLAFVILAAWAYLRKLARPRRTRRRKRSAWFDSV